MKKCIVVVDMQNDFIDGSLGTKEAQEMLPRLAAKLENQREADLFFTQDTHGDDYLETQEGQNLPIRHCIKPEKGWEICDALKNFAQKSVVIEKPTFGATSLPQHLAEYDEIELVGLCTDICVISNALLLKAFYPEKKILVDGQCCAGVTPESHLQALEAMKMCQIKVLG